MPTVYDDIGASAAELRVGIDAAEAAALVEGLGIDGDGIRAVASVFDALAERHRQQAVETLPRLSRLPRAAPRTFGGFDFSRIEGRDAAALRALPELSNLYARKNIAFIGPEGIGKTHLAQAYGRECCLRGLKTYYLKASELRDKLRRAADSGDTSRTVTAPVRPSCLIVDEVGRCQFDRECTDLFFDVVDRRYEKEDPNVLVLTSNTPPNNWRGFFTGDDTLLCALDRIFDRASVFVMQGASFRGAECETFSVEAKAAVAKQRGRAPENR